MKRVKRVNMALIERFQNDGALNIESFCLDIFDTEFEHMLAMN